MEAEHINSNILRLKPSASIAMMDKARALKSQGYDVISLAGGEPDFDTPAPVAEAGIRAIRDGRTHYTAGRGILRLREAIARKLTQENGVACDAENILVTPGGKYAISLTISTLINPGDAVMILDPSWVSYAPIVEIAGGVPVSVPLSLTDNYAITEALLERYFTPRVRILILNTPNNPTGRVLTTAEAQAVETFLLRHDILLISDEVYEKILYDGRTHISMGSFPRIAKKVVTVNSFSKCAAMTGWRVGYLCAEKSLVDAVYLSYQHTLTCVSEFSQIAAIAALDCLDEMERMRQIYAYRRDLLIGKLREIPGITCVIPEGAFYAWCRIERNNMSSTEICAYLLEQAQVVAVDGFAYGLSSEKCVRMSFAASECDLLAAAERIKNAILSGRRL